MDIDTLNAVGVDNSLQVRFIPVENSRNNEKMPKYRASISLTHGLSGLVLETPIFKDAKTGKFTVSMPGGRFSALKAEPKTVNVNGQELVLAESSSEGQAKIDRWESAILTAFYAAESTKNPVQRITL